MDCVYSSCCRRYAYTKWFQKNGAVAVPTCFSLVLQGYGGAEILEARKRIYAEKFPCFKDGVPENFCPVLIGERDRNCYEYKKEQKRQERLKKGREKREQYTDGRRRVFLSRSLRNQIASRDHFTCVYCGRSHNSIDGDGRKVRIVIDHFLPLAKGGSPDSPENLTVACRDCNQAKSAQIWDRGCRKDYYA